VRSKPSHPPPSYVLIGANGFVKEGEEVFTTPTAGKKKKEKKRTRPPYPSDQGKGEKETIVYDNVARSKTGKKPNMSTRASGLCNRPREGERGKIGDRKGKGGWGRDQRAYCRTLSRLRYKKKKGGRGVSGTAMCFRSPSIRPEGKRRRRNYQISTPIGRVVSIRERPLNVPSYDQEGYAAPSFFSS